MTWPPWCVADTRRASTSPESLCEQRRERLASGDQLAAVVMRDQAVGELWRAESRQGAMTIWGAMDRNSEKIQWAPEGEAGEGQGRFPAQQSVRYKAGLCGLEREP